MKQMGNDTNDELQPEHDFSAGTRGKHHASYQTSNNVVLLDPDRPDQSLNPASIGRSDVAAHGANAGQLKSLDIRGESHPL